MSAPVTAESIEKAGRAITEAEWAELRRQSLDAIPAMHEAGKLPDLLLPYQQRGVELVEDLKNSVIVVEKSRRIGYTWALAAAAVLRASRGRTSGGMDAMYISYSQEMTREFVDAAAMWARAFALAAAEEQEFLFEDADPDHPDDTRQIKAFRIRFASGFEIIALSSAPRSLRGKQGLLIVDEAAFVESLAELLKAAMAFLMWGGQVVVVSTHNGTQNPFNELVQDIRAGRVPYTLVRVDLDDALREGLYERICLVKGDEHSVEAEAKWRSDLIAFYREASDEELFCIPTEGSGAWLTSALIEARMQEGIPVIDIELPTNFLHLRPLEQKALVEPAYDEIRRVCGRLDRRETHALGFDFARHVDLSVAWILAVDRVMKRRTRLVLNLRRVPYNEQAAIVIFLIRLLPRFIGGAFDATGAGEAVAEACQREISLTAIEAIKLSREWYRTEMPPLKVAFEDDSIVIPKDREIHDDLKLVKVIDGIPLIPRLKTEGTTGKRHGDGTVALALGYYKTRNGAAEYDYTPASALDGDSGASPFSAGELDVPARALW